MEGKEYIVGISTLYSSKLLSFHPIKEYLENIYIMVLRNILGYIFTLFQFLHNYLPVKHFKTIKNLRVGSGAVSAELQFLNRASATQIKFGFSSRRLFFPHEEA